MFLILDLNLTAGQAGKVWDSGGEKKYQQFSSHSNLDFLPKQLCGTWHRANTQTDTSLYTLCFYIPHFKYWQRMGNPE